MANEYVDIGTLKASFGTTDTARDDLLTAAIAAASRLIDRNTGRRFYLDAAVSQRTYKPDGRALRKNDGELLIVDDIGSLTGLIVEVGSVGGTYTAITDYETTPENATPRGLPVTGLLRTAGTWGRGTSRVRVTAKWGWPAVPDEIAQAALIQAARLVKRKDTPEGVLGSADWGGALRLGRIDPDVFELTKHLTLPGF
ncbi:phage gp6-like head-tail connector protein [Streptomyces sp. NPDC058466]|uniref:phage gp6-like head-tail connector protein n=1 Tax=Streptomyces sp. NPDC058466 TaxID=3346512 RepID=UPI003647A5FF